MAENKSALVEVNIKIYDVGAMLTLSTPKTSSEYALSQSSTNYINSILNQAMDESLCLEGPECRLTKYANKNK